LAVIASESFLSPPDRLGEDGEAEWLSTIKRRKEQRIKMKGFA
jgi:hypothetical protein